jgi:hypothetical protein
VVNFVSAIGGWNSSASTLPQERMSRKVTEMNDDLILRDGEPTMIVTRKKRNANFGSKATGTTNLSRCCEPNDECNGFSFQDEELDSINRNSDAAG